jgi:hypothetical protein
LALRLLEHPILLRYRLNQSYVFLHLHDILKSLLTLSSPPTGLPFNDLYLLISAIPYLRINSYNNLQLSVCKLPPSFSKNLLPEYLNIAMLTDGPHRWLSYVFSSPAYSTFGVTVVVNMVTNNGPHLLSVLLYIDSLPTGTNATPISKQPIYYHPIPTLLRSGDVNPSTSHILHQLQTPPTPLLSTNYMVVSVSPTVFNPPSTLNVWNSIVNKANYARLSAVSWVFNPLP